MSIERQKFLVGWRRLSEADRKRTFRPVLVGARASAGVPISDLTVRRVALRITQAGNGATLADVGKFWFVPGYSLVDGPDIIPESEIEE